MSLHAVAGHNFDRLITADIQFYVFMRSATDLSREKIYGVFDVLDVDHSGLLDFDEFYLLVCILIAVRVSLEDSHWGEG